MNSKRWIAFGNKYETQQNKKFIYVELRKFVIILNV
nr:MAG TPA: hypothetical protein [Caudoviricetes sp.]